VTRFAALLPALALLFTGCGRDSRSEAPRPPLRVHVLSTGTSMLPTFSERETVALDIGTRFSDLQPGDTVIFWHGETRQYVHHRLSHRDTIDGRWHTYGDNNPGRDWGRFTADEFIGRTHKLPLKP
jgi:hypothetical protein